MKCVRMHRIALTMALAVVLTLSVAGVAMAASSSSVSGQAFSARKLAKPVRMPTGARSDTTFSITTAKGTRITGYAVSSTVFFERGPNDEGYHRVGRSQAYTVFRSWGGSGNCPAKFVYRSYRAQGKTYRVLLKVQYFMAGE